MAVESFTKQPYEEWVIAGSIEDVVDTGETITLGSCDVKAWQWDDLTQEETTNVIEIATLSKDDTLHYLKVRVKGGTTAIATYKITFYIVTSLSNKYEIDVKMKIKEF